MAKKDESGTTISFRPDAEVFEETEFDASTLLQRLRETAFLTRGLRIVLTDERAGGEHVEFHYEGGIRDFVAHVNASKDSIHKHIVYFEGENEKGAVEVAMQWNDRRACPAYFEELLIDRRGGDLGAGEPPGVVELLRVYGERVAGRLVHVPGVGRREDVGRREHQEPALTHLGNEVYISRIGHLLHHGRSDTDELALNLRSSSKRTHQAPRSLRRIHGLEDEAELLRFFKGMIKLRRQTGYARHAGVLVVEAGADDQFVVVRLARALDLGTGCGVQALHASRHARRCGQSAHVIRAG